jgi:colicin import membrane protein
VCVAASPVAPAAAAMDVTPDDRERLREERRKRIEAETKAFEEEMKVPRCCSIASVALLLFAQKKEEEREKRRHERLAKLKEEEDVLKADEAARKAKLEEERRKNMAELKGAGVNVAELEAKEKQRKEEEAKREAEEKAAAAAAVWLSSIVTGLFLAVCRK